jgi:hypothetical protein
MPGETWASFFCAYPASLGSLRGFFFFSLALKSNRFPIGIGFAHLGRTRLSRSICMATAAVFPKCKPLRIGLVLIAGLQILTACGEESAGPAGDPDAQLILLEPTGGETFHVGDSLKVRWKAQGKGLEEISSVAITLSPDSGQTWLYLLNGSIAPSDGEWGAFGWKIPDAIAGRGENFELSGNTRILVRVQDYQNTSDPHKTAVTPKPIAVKP